MRNTVTESRSIVTWAWKWGMHKKWWSQRGVTEGITKKYKENFRDGGYIYYISFVDVFMSVCIGQNLFKYVLFMIIFTS